MSLSLDALNPRSSQHSFLAVLQDNAAPKLRVTGHQARTLMAKATSDIDEDRTVGLDCGKRGRGYHIEPVTVTWHAHELLEPLQRLRVLLSPREEVKVRIGTLVPSEPTTGVVLVLVLLEKTGESLVGGAADVESVQVIH